MKMQNPFFTKHREIAIKVLKCTFLPHIFPVCMHAPLSHWTLLKKWKFSDKWRISRWWQHEAWVWGPVWLLRLIALPWSWPCLREQKYRRQKPFLHNWNWTHLMPDCNVISPKEIQSNLGQQTTGAQAGENLHRETRTMKMKEQGLLCQSRSCPCFLLRCEVTPGHGYIKALRRQWKS